ncbi:hypothetical protein chiPu_0008011 [Chiloscyllium punctatum]|uniref:Uncharacterized protein n=1 Tax=Chiloscyllium punctatum TaxID=137246 RepID=A0A401SGM2_CHIPU|nr:hypothetical protein [Chiloscyllium punctatum]
MEGLTGQADPGVRFLAGLGQSRRWLTVRILREQGELALAWAGLVSAPSATVSSPRVSIPFRLSGRAGLQQTLRGLLLLLGSVRGSGAGLEQAGPGTGGKFEATQVGLIWDPLGGAVRDWITGDQTGSGAGGRFEITQVGLIWDPLGGAIGDWITGDHTGSGTGFEAAHVDLIWDSLGGAIRDWITGDHTGSGTGFEATHVDLIWDPLGGAIRDWITGDYTGSGTGDRFDVTQVGLIWDPLGGAIRNWITGDHTGSGTGDPRPGLLVPTGPGARLGVVGPSGRRVPGARVLPLRAAPQAGVLRVASEPVRFGRSRARSSGDRGLGRSIAAEALLEAGGSLGLTGGLQAGENAVHPAGRSGQPHPGHLLLSLLMDLVHLEGKHTPGLLKLGFASFPVHSEQPVLGSFIHVQIFDEFTGLQPQILIFIHVDYSPPPKNKILTVANQAGRKQKLKLTPNERSSSVRTPVGEVEDFILTLTPSQKSVLQLGVLLC